MKTITKSENSKPWNIFKQALYALQVIIIALAIPVLSYMEVSHSDKTPHSSDRNASKAITAKPEAIAYNQAIK